MAQPTQQQPDFEVRCELCDVSFPVGTKRCIHCGEKIGKPLFFPTTDEDGMPLLQRAEPLEEIDEAEAQPRRGRFLRAGFTLVWVVLALMSAAVRACQEG